MSSLGKIREALAEVVETGVQEEIHVYQNIPDVLQFPAVIIRPDSADFAGAMNRGDDVWKLDLFIIVGRVDTTDASERLDEFAGGSGLSSIRSAIEDNYSLGLDDTSCFVRGVKGYGGGFETAKTRHVGAILKVEVHTDGSQI
ncbi:hypothetical protein ACWD2L_05845 [Streptomyces sp. NPDC002754]